MRQPTQSEREAAWEALCDGCGKCCSIQNFGPDGRNEGCGVACPSLDTETNRCTAYSKRHDVETCLPVRPSNVRHLHRAGILPDSCAYVRHMQGKPPLPRPVARARLVPFKLADLDIQKHYILRREQWFASTNAQDDPPK